MSTGRDGSGCFYINVKKKILLVNKNRFIQSKLNLFTLTSKQIIFKTSFR